MDCLAEERPITTNLNDLGFGENGEGLPSKNQSIFHAGSVWRGFVHYHGGNEHGLYQELILAARMLCVGFRKLPAHPNPTWSSSPALQGAYALKVQDQAFRLRGGSIIKGLEVYADISPRIIETTLSQTLLP